MNIANAGRYDVFACRKTDSLFAHRQLRDFNASNFRSAAFLAVAAPNKTNTAFEGDSHYSS